MTRSARCRLIMIVFLFLAWFLMPVAVVPSSPASAQAAAGGASDVPLVGDLDGDGKADLSVWRPGTAQFHWLTSSSGYSYGAAGTEQWGSVGDGSDVPLMDDLDGDGKADLILWRPGSGRFRWRTSSSGYNEGAAGTKQWGSVGDVPLTGDLDGDAKADLIIWRPGSGKYFWLTSSSGYSYGAARARQWGSSGDVPRMGDLDGDGKADLIFWRPQTGKFFWLTSSSRYNYGAAGSKQWGSVGGVPDVPLIGDLDGDGKADLIFWRPGTGTFSCLTSSTGYNSAAAGTRQWGSVGGVPDVPLTGDLDGDGKADLIVWRPGIGEFRWLTSSSGYDYGAAGSRLSFYIPAVNQPPTVSAGFNQAVTLPVPASLNGTVSDDGLPTGGTLTRSWSKVSGTGTVTFGNVNTPSTTATFSAAGTYVLRLTATDGALSAKADVTVAVNGANKAPTVSAGSPQTITLPASASLNGTASDDGLPGGSTLTTQWSKVGGPGSITFGNSAARSTTASFSAAGLYVLGMSATDGALTTSSTVTIAVNAAQAVNQPPTVSAGSNQSITLPASASLNGTASDDGLPAGSALIRTWSRVSGPGTVTFGNVNAQSTTASFSVGRDLCAPLDRHRQCALGDRRCHDQRQRHQPTAHVADEDRSTCRSRRLTPTRGLTPGHPFAHAPGMTAAPAYARAPRSCLETRLRSSVAMCGHPRPH